MSGDRRTFLTGLKLKLVEKPLRVGCIFAKSGEISELWCGGVVSNIMAEMEAAGVRRASGVVGGGNAMQREPRTRPMMEGVKMLDLGHRTVLGL